MPELGTCPDLTTLGKFASEERSAEEIEAVAQHLEQCSRCAEAIEQLMNRDLLCAAMAGHARGTDERDRAEVEGLILQVRRLRPLGLPREQTPPPGADAALDQPTMAEDISTEDVSFLAPRQGPDELGRLGPYQVRHVLGAGGMGVVFAAVDPHDRSELLRWSGSGNVYRLGIDTFMPGTEIDYVKAWSERWKSSEEGSVMADPLDFDPLQWRLLPGSSGYKQGLDGKDLGADVDRIARLPLP